MVISGSNGYCLFEIARLVGQVEDGRWQEFMSGIAGKPKGPFVGLWNTSLSVIKWTMINYLLEKTPKHEDRRRN